MFLTSLRKTLSVSLPQSSWPWLPLQEEAEELLLLDLREVQELVDKGTIPGAQHVPRGMLEFWIDPESPYHKPVFNQDKTYVFYCASAWRMRASALGRSLSQTISLAIIGS